jgi:hypothetical protein
MNRCPLVTAHGCGSGQDVHAAAGRRLLLRADDKSAARREHGLRGCAKGSHAKAARR